MTSDRYSVLLIEDSPAEQGLFRELVARKKLPYDLMVSSSVAEAKETLSEAKFDVVLADYRLDDGTAFDVIGQIDEDTPIIFITGWGNLEIAVKAIRAGAADFIEKDSHRRYFETIPRVIERVISIKRSKDQYKMLHELHETVLANSFDAFAIIDLEGNVIFANDSLVNLSRYLKEELAGLNLSSLTIGDTRFVAMVIRSCQKGQKLINLETTLLPKTGPAIPVALSAVQVKNHEKILICMRDLRAESDLSEEVRLLRKFSVNLIHAGLLSGERKDQIRYSQKVCHLLKKKTNFS
ncbi:MAG: response regulator [Candidatus Hodarchaeales archaeon]|jgi:PAS domain S-box-containing protein